MDGDKVEAKNLKRQLFIKFDLGEFKSKALAERLDRYGFSVEAVPEYLGEKNIKELLKDIDIVVMGVDSDFTKLLVLKNFDGWIISGQNDVEDGTVFVWKKPMPYEMLHLSESDPDRSTMGCADLAQLDGGEQTALVNALAAYWIYNSLTMLLSGKGPEWDIIFFHIDGRTQTECRGLFHLNSR